MFAHARHMAPLAVDCTFCPAKVGQRCRSRKGVQQATFHDPRREAVENLPDAVKDQVVEMVSTLLWMRKLAGGVEGAEMLDVVAEIGVVVAAALTEVSV
jgi:hypothetical protein